MKKRESRPSVAPGMDDHEELERKATDEEIERGKYTSVTHLSFDEVNHD